MAKVQRIAVARKQGQRRIELPDQVEVSLAGLAGRAKQELLAFAVSVGLEVFATMLEEDRTRSCGPRGRHDPDVPPAVTAASRREWYWEDVRCRSIVPGPARLRARR